MLNIKKFTSHKLLQTGVRFSIVSTMKSVATMIVGLAIMFWLTPMEVGMWNAVSLFLAYGPLFQLGIQSGLNIELPILLGKGDENNAKEYVANAFGYAVIISLVFLISGSVLSIFVYYKYGLSLAMGVLTIIMMSVFASFQLHMAARYRSAKAFDRLSSINLVDTVLIVVLVWFIYKYHYWGILIYNVVYNLVDLVLLFRYAPYRNIKPKFELQRLFSLGKVGVALMILIQLRTAAQTLPRWIIIVKAGTEKLGLFTPAMAVNALISLIPGQIAQFFHPQMGYIYGKTGQARNIWKYVKILFIILPIATIPIAAAIWAFAPWLLETFFPKYLESLWAMRIMAVAFTFSSAATTSWVLNTLKAFKYSYFFSICDFCGAFVYPYLMVSLTQLNILEAVTLGLAINCFISYWLNVFVLRHVLFLDRYNQGNISEHGS